MRASEFSVAKWFAAAFGFVALLIILHEPADYLGGPRWVLWTIGLVSIAIGAGCLRVLLPTEWRARSLSAVGASALMVGVIFAMDTFFPDTYPWAAIVFGVAFFAAFSLRDDTTEG